MELLDFKTPVPSIDFSSSKNTLGGSQQDREMDLQRRAGITPTADYAGIRQQLAQQQFGEEMGNMYTVAESSLQAGFNPETVADYVRSYQARNGEEDLDVSLEIAAASKETEEAFTNNSKTAMNNAVDNDDVSERMSKNEIYTTWLKELKDHFNSFSGWRKFGAYTEQMLIPEKFETLEIRSYLPKEATEGVGMNRQQLTDKVREDIAMAAEMSTPKEFKQYLDTLSSRLFSDKYINPVIAERFIDDMVEGITGWEDAFGAVDLALGASTGMRAVSRIAQAASAAGDINKLRRTARETFQAHNTEELLQDFLSPSAVKPVQNSAAVASDARVAEMMGDQVSSLEAQQALQRWVNTGVYSDEELKAMSEALQKDVKKVFNVNDIDPVDVYMREADDGKLYATGLFGDSQGNALDLKSANRLAKNMQLKEGSYQLVKKDAEGYFVQVDNVIDDTTAYGRKLMHESVLNAADEVKEWRFEKDTFGIFNGLLRYFGGSTRIGTEAHARAVEGDRISNAVTSWLQTTYKKSMNNLSKKDKAILQNLYEQGQHENGGFGKWFSKEELDAMTIPENIQKSYFDFKTVSDLEYLANNAEKRRELVRKGYKMYDKYVGVEEDFAKLKGSNYIVADAEGNIVPLSEVEKLNQSEYRLVRVHRGMTTQDDLTATHVLLNKTTSAATDLPTFVTHYMPGGRRQYVNGTLFVKVGRSWYNPTTGTKLNGYAKTLVAGTDEKALNEYAQEVNKLIDLWNDPSISDVYKARELANMDLKHFKVDSWDDLKELIRTKDNPKGIIDPEYKAQVLEKNGIYTYNNSLQTVQEDLNDVDWAMQDILDTRSRYNRSRGNLLDDVNGNKVRLMNIQDIFDKTASKAAYALAKGDLAHWYAKDMQRFKSVISNWDDIQEMSDLDKVMNAVLIDSKSASPEQLNMIRSARRFLEHGFRVLNGRTKYDKFLENVMLKTAKGIDAYMPFEMRGGKAFERIANFNPARIAKGIGFNYVMGWWNPAQLYKQGLGVLNVAALEPVNAAKALQLYPLIRLAKGTAEGHSALFNVYKKVALKLSGMSSLEFDDMLKFMDRYGTQKSAGLLVANEYSASLRRNKGLLSRVWDSQYTFMNEGNAANYYIADIAAYLSRKGKSWKEVAAYSDDLFLNMTKSSESAFQKGQFLPTSVFTQWMTYPTRMVEAMMNTRLSKAQRLRLAATQFMLWGFGGTLLTDRQELNAFTALQEHGLSDEQATSLTNGLMGYIGKELGIDFDEGLHILEQLDFVGNFIGMLEEGEIKFPTIPAAQVGNQITAFIKAGFDLVNPPAGVYDMNRWAKSVATTKSLPSSFRNLAKAAIAWNYHNFYNNKGQQLNKEDVETYRAVLQALGFQPYEQKLDRMMQLALTQRDETLQDSVKSLKPFADAIRHYVYVEGDAQKNKENLDRLYHEWDLNLKITRDSLLTLYGEGDTISKFDKAIFNLLYTGETNITEDLKAKTVKGLGTVFKDMITRKYEENLYGTNG